MRIVAFIPARGGSKGLKRKNLKLLGNHPLISWPIKHALESKFINDVIVTTDDDEIADDDNGINVEINEDDKN